MGRGVARHSLNVARRINQTLHLGIGVIHLLQLRILGQRRRQRDVKLIRNRLCHHVRLGVGHVERAAHVADCAARRHRAEGDNLRHTVLAVFARHVINDLAPSLLTEIRVKVRHGNTFRIQEAFKNQRILHGVDLGDVHAVGNNRGCAGASAGADRNSLLLGPADKVRHDQEVIDVAHLFNDAHLIIQPLSVGLLRLRIALRKAVLTELVEVGQGIRAVRRFKRRQVVVSEFKLDLAALCNAGGVFERLLQLREKAAQLFLGFYIELVAFKAHSVRIVHGLPHLNAHQHVLRRRVLLAQVVRIVRHHQRKLQLPRKAQQHRVDPRLLRDSVILQLQIEMLRPEDVAVFQGDLLCALIVVDFQSARNRTGQTCGKGNQPL